MLEGYWFSSGSAGDAAEGHRGALPTHPTQPADLSKRIPIKNYTIPAAKRKKKKVRIPHEDPLKFPCLKNNANQLKLVAPGTPGGTNQR